jgi:exosortase
VRTLCTALLPPAVLLAGLLWAYAPELRGMAERWSNDPQYSHGYLVPAFAAVLLWLRRGLLAGGRGSWWGLALLAAGLPLRLAGTIGYLGWLEGASLLPCLLGVPVLFGGRRGLVWAWPAVLFLLFMVPLPYRVQTALAHPLQHAATLASTYALQTLGLPAVSEGNVIVLNEVKIGIVEACSGLTMLDTFFALATALALVIRRPWTDRVGIVLSAVPIALAVNVARITVTAVLHEKVGDGAARAVFHDWAGWLMMPLALGLLWLVLAALKALFVERPARRPVPLSFLRARPASSPSRPAAGEREKSKA